MVVPVKTAIINGEVKFMEFEHGHCREKEAEQE